MGPVNGFSKKKVFGMGGGGTRVGFGEIFLWEAGKKDSKKGFGAKQKKKLAGFPVGGGN